MHKFFYASFFCISSQCSVCLDHKIFFSLTQGAILVPKEMAGQYGQGFKTIESHWYQEMERTAPVQKLRHLFPRAGYMYVVRHDTWKPERRKFGISVRGSLRRAGQLQPQPTNRP